MKLLLFSDIHCSKTAVEKLLVLAEQVDLVVGAGDFGTMRRGIKETLDGFRGLDKALVLVPGNAESAEELRDAANWNDAHVLHGTAVRLGGVDFYGLGGGVPVTPFGAWSYDLTEPEATEKLADCPDQCVLITHSPPHGAVDLSSAGTHLGSTAIRQTILKCKPRLAVCGHIHDSAGQWELLEETPVVNAGPKGMVWDMASGQPQKAP